MSSAVADSGTVAASDADVEEFQRNTKRGIWINRLTNKTWTTTDNGQDVDYSGQVAYWRVTDSGIDSQQVVGKWGTDLKLVVPVMSYGQQNLILLSKNGFATYLFFNGKPTDVTGPMGKMGTSFKQIVSFLSGGEQYLLFYENNGLATLARWDRGGFKQSIDLGTWDTHWRHIVPVTLNGVPRLLFYADNGHAVLYCFNGKGIDEAKDLGMLDANWRQIIPITLNGTQYLLFQHNNGEVSRWRLSAGGDLEQKTQLGKWDTDFSHIIPMQ